MTIPPPPKTPNENYLFLAVLPLVHYSRHFAGERFEEVMTLVPDRNFATEFRRDVVDIYIQTFKSAAEEKYGGPVRKFKYEIADAYADNKVVVLVTPYD
jgi:hypothetical protein